MAKSLRQRRHKARILAMQALFQLEARKMDAQNIAEISSFNWIDYPVPEEEREFARKIIEVTVKNLALIDALITERLVNWEFSRISPVSRAVLRTGAAQILYLADQADIPVVIDESILLAKQYDAAEAAGFVNGVLDDIYLSRNPDAQKMKKAPALAKKIIIKKKISPKKS